MHLFCAMYCHCMAFVDLFFILQTYNYTFQEQDNGKTLHCVARLIAYPDHKLMTAQQLNVMCK